MKPNLLEWRMHMCGRYNVDFEANKELKKILGDLNKKYPGNHIKQGEVFPTNEAAIMVGEQEEVVNERSIWGFPQYTGKGVIINARSETVYEKKTFRQSMSSRRCVVPTSGFYEWDKEKNKYLFQEEENEVLYLGGLYQFYNEVSRFVILTREANASMEPIHHRMPIILREDQIKSWLLEQEVANTILTMVPGQLMRVKTN